MTLPEAIVKAAELLSGAIVVAAFVRGFLSERS
jgi:hypothetical protein